MILNLNNIETLETYLKNKFGFQADEKIIDLTKAGDGNMNCVLRVKTSKRSFICKQSKGFVEKYPQILAPAERVQFEAAFYNKIKQNKKIKAMMPEIFYLDVDNNILIMEDLGEIEDYNFLYNLKNQISENEIALLSDFLNELHDSFLNNTLSNELVNYEMRLLNYEHIFNYPFIENNGFDLDTIQKGLNKISIPYKRNEVLKKKILNLGERYLQKGNCLLHGDFYPGSWLKSEETIKIIDPEFCFFGHREFDLGVLIAHLHLTNQKSNIFEVVEKNYLSFSKLNQSLLNGYIGVEIMRRLIGLAQLPLKMDLENKKRLLKKAEYLILSE